MKHKSVPVAGSPCEFINITPVNPLISKCHIKVCYVGETPNRNGSIITKKVAISIAKSLPGSPIVGKFDSATEDFEEHNQVLKISGGEYEIIDDTRPYGFVSMDAKCWFQWFLDDDSVTREYLVTEGYIWTGQYPESKRIIEQGNNQSFELDERLTEGFWTKSDNGNPEFFIINESVVSKLCILGEEFEPCFEGASIAAAPLNYALDDKSQEKLLFMLKELQEYLTSEGGKPKVFKTYAAKVGDQLWNTLYSLILEKHPSENGEGGKYRIEGFFEGEDSNFAVLQDKSDSQFYRLNFSLGENDLASFKESLEKFEEYSPSENPQFSLEEVQSFELNFKKKKEEDDEDVPKSDDEKSEKEDKDDEKEKKKTKYSLEDIPEYVELASKFSELNQQHQELVSKYELLNSEVEPLKQFKAEADRERKQNMIDSFYMLSDDDKKDVIDNIDKYSLDDIEAKLSILCVRNKVSFNQDPSEEGAPNMYSLNNGMDLSGDSTPGWVKAALEVAKTLN